MRKSVVCILAHPDDEAFGPGGTIAKLSKENDVYLLCATKGEAGLEGKVKDIANIREKELMKSANILGVKKVYFLGFEDGTLCNNLYHKLASAIKEKLDFLKPQILITFEPRGVSGHIDHMTVSMVTTYVFQKSAYIKKLCYYCLPDWLIKKMRERMSEYFIYFPPGYKKSDIDIVIDTSSVWEKKVEAMKKHQSQIRDVNRILNFQKQLPKKEYFIVLKK